MLKRLLMFELPHLWPLNELDLVTLVTKEYMEEPELLPGIGGMALLFYCSLAADLWVLPQDTVLIYKCTGMSWGTQRDRSTVVLSGFKWNEIILGLSIMYIHSNGEHWFFDFSCACVNYNRTLPILCTIVKDTCFNVQNHVDACYSVNLAVNFYLQRRKRRGCEIWRFHLALFSFFPKDCVIFLFCWVTVVVKGLEFFLPQNLVYIGGS